MTVRGKAPTVPATEEQPVEVALARAMVLASTIVAQDRDPTPAESAWIANAQVRAEAAGVEAASAPFATYHRYMAHREQLAADAARREQDRLEKEERRLDWLARPARFRALPDDVKLLFHVAAFVVSDASLRGSDLLTALEAARAELLLPESERVVPYQFEAGLVSEAKRLRFTVDGVQRLGGPA